MVSNYVSMRIREGMARIARENPSLDWKAESPALTLAENKLNESIRLWHTDPAARLADVLKAFRAWERELLAANRTQETLFA
jgi:hypothetical protein